MLDYAVSSSDFIAQYQTPAPTYQQLPVGPVPPFVVEETSSQHHQPFLPQNLLESPNAAADTSPDTPTERFFITAVDQAGDGSYAERLTQVIQAKFEAGLLKPYDYSTGYARLLRHADLQCVPCRMGSSAA
ncbi:MAG: hypothetical protein BJ554DRAFT_1357 [Olpidium bornovanus]|uniref:Uncharacterized protein n=1 Tax=Olpidium bornovanus TaxID=278681 RepID=A0A8H8DH99_9FUNG|nr:MAG: hypothetical protein BJ554DRAFT_1357 [Olpidium bornovanus]